MRWIGAVATLVAVLAAGLPGAVAEPVCGLYPNRDWRACHDKCPERPIEDALSCIRVCLDRLFECRAELRKHGVVPDSIDGGAAYYFTKYHPRSSDCLAEYSKQHECEVAACGDAPKDACRAESKCEQKEVSDFCQDLRR